MMNKRELRASIRRCHQGEAARRAQSDLICRYILESDAYRRVRVIAGYVPLKWEADILSVLDSALQAGKQVVLPVCGKAPLMTLHQIISLSELVPGAYGIPQPPADAPQAEAEDVDLILVPLEGIDSRGRRLGKGGGYYDRLLQNRQITALGCALTWQCVEDVPCDPWDIPLPMWVTPNGMYSVATDIQSDGNKGRNTQYGKQEELKEN